MSAVLPTRRRERELLERQAIVAGMDEVGRGALAGPVTVGLAVVDRLTSEDFPDGLADSKQLSARRRAGLVEPCRRWLRDYAVGHASAAEIDALGVVGALRLAGRRALTEVVGRGNGPQVVLLDGSSDWLSARPVDLLTSLEEGERAGGSEHLVEAPRVVMEVKADASCAVVAAASVLAKVERDALMEACEDPGYGWASNKGYASAAHVEGLRRLGPSAWHRRSWRLPGVD